MDDLQLLVEEYKSSKKKSLFKQIQDSLLSYFYTNGVSRLSNDQLHRVLVSLFVPAKEGGMSDLEKSIEKYQPDYKQDGSGKVPFFPFFFNLLKRRMYTIYEEDKKITYRELTNDQTLSFHLTEPQQLQQFAPSNDNISGEVIQEILAEQISPLIIKAEASINNPSYRDPFLFMLLFPNNLSQQEIASLFGIKSNTINANLRRAKTQFAESFTKLANEEADIDIQALNDALNHLSLQIQGSLENHLNNADERNAIRARFTLGWPREKVCAEFKISTELLKKLEQKLLREFIAQTNKLHSDTIRTFAEGENEMTFYEQFRDYLNGAQMEDVSRAPLPISSKEFSCYELIKNVLPTPNQRTNKKITEKIANMSEEAILSLCDKLGSTPAELALEIQKESPDSDLRCKLLKELEINTQPFKKPFSSSES